MDKFSRLFYDYTDGEYDYLRVKNIDVNTESKVANAYLYVREDKYDHFDNAVIKRLREFFGEIVPGYRFNFFFERLLVSADLVHRRVVEYISVNYPFVAANIVADTIDVEVTGNRIECRVYMPQYILQYATERHFVEDLKEDLADAFIMPADVKVELTDVVVEESEAVDSGRTFTAVPVDNIKYLCGVKSDYSRMPTMLSYVRQEAERTAVCGDMSDMRQKVYEPEAPREGEKQRRFYKYHYTFTLNDGTDNIRVLFNTNDEKCPLATITQGQFMVRGRVFFNERTQSFNVFAKTVYSCTIDKQKLDEILKPLPVPDAYRIEPVAVAEEIRPMQLTLGLEGEGVVSQKRLAGEHVFLYLRSTAKDKIIPYELAAIRTDKGKPYSLYHTYIYAGDLLQIDADIKTAVATAPRISDVVPDIIKFCEGATVVCFQLDQTQKYLVDIAKALRYAFSCEWNDADGLLKKGKETLSFAKACRAKHIAVHNDGAVDMAHALYELFLQEKGIGQA